MKNICMVTTSEIYHDSRILNEASTLSRNYKLTILAKKYFGQKRQKLSLKIKLIPYFKLPWGQFSIFSSFFSLMKAAFKEKADIYHAHDLDGLLCAFPAALIRRKILIYDSHELWSDTYPFANLKGIRFLLPILERLLVWRVGVGITVNQTIASFLTRKYHREFLALYNASKSSNQKKTQLNLRQKFPEKTIVLHIGAADEGRGMEQIIGAAKFLPPSFMIVFLGGGKTKNQAQKLADQLNLKNIAFFPPVPPQEIVSVASQADLGLALTQKISRSYYYSLPNKIFQYLEAKIPILASNFPEMKKIVTVNNIGQVVNPAKPKEIASAIKNIVKKIQLYKKNYQKIEGRYTWEKESQKLINFYDKFAQTPPPISRRFKIDVMANIISLFAVGLCGVIFNVIIARVYGAAALGVFNLVYAFYILASQVAVGSIHLSVQKYIPALLDKRQDLNKLISAGLGLTLICSLTVSVFVYFSRNLFLPILKEPDVVLGIGLIAFGLIGFALNKTLLAILNGFQKMRAFAFFSGLRYLLILGFIVLLVALGRPAGILPLAFPMAEVVILFVLLAYCLRFFWPTTDLSDWPKKHLLFAYRSFLGNILTDVNARVNILVLGVFASPQAVGIYSLAALFAESLYQVGGVLKFNINPVLARLASKDDRSNLKLFVQRGVKLTYFYFSLLTVAAIGLYPIFIDIFLGHGDFNQSWPIFAILMTGLAISSGYQPFQMLLAQAGFPKLYSWLIFVVFAINLILNLVMVPSLGMYGSALATAISFVSSALVLRFLTRKALKIKI